MTVYPGNDTRKKEASLLKSLPTSLPTKKLVIFEM